jgi:hypothetical protein
MVCGQPTLWADRLCSLECAYRIENKNLLADNLSLQSERDSLRASLTATQERLGEVTAERDGARAGLVDLQAAESAAKQSLNVALVKIQEMMTRAFKAEADRDAALARAEVAEGLLREARESVEYRRDNADDCVNCDEIEEADLLLDRIDAALRAKAGDGEV